MDKNYTKIPNELFDVLLKTMSPSAWKVASVIARKTIGWRKKSDVISLTQFEEMTGMSRKPVLAAIKELREHGWIKQEPAGNSFSYCLSESILTSECSNGRRKKAEQAVEDSEAASGSCLPKNGRQEPQKPAENGVSNSGVQHKNDSQTPPKSVAECHTQKKGKKTTKENNRDVSNFQTSQVTDIDTYVGLLIYKHLREDGLKLWHKVYAKQTILSWLREGRFTANAIIYALAYSLEKGGSPGLVYNMLKIAPAKELPEFSDAYNIDTGNPLWKDYMWLSPEEEAAEKERLPDVW